MRSVSREADGARLEMPRYSDSSLRLVAPWVGRRGLYDLAGRSRFPTAEGAVRPWPRFLVPWKTFATNLARLEKARRLLGTRSAWRPKAPAVAFNG